jgi:hypothetical protein
LPRGSIPPCSTRRPVCTDLTSPDDGDALTLTFAAPVEQKDDSSGLTLGPGDLGGGGGGSWMEA